MIAPLETLTVEIDSDVLAQAEKVCADIGITLQDAVNMFLRETVIQQRWPMDTMDSELPETPELKRTKLRVSASRPDFPTTAAYGPFRRLSGRGCGKVSSRGPIGLGRFISVRFCAWIFSSVFFRSSTKSDIFAPTCGRRIFTSTVIIQRINSRIPLRAH